MKLNLQLPKSLEKIVRNIETEGGKSYLVGGAVIDAIQERQIKDWDIEVYGLNYQRLQNILASYGKANLVGQSFGIIKLRQEDIEYDFNIPRKENKIGIGHKGFEVELDSNITPKEAAYRRDLTINSMFFDLSNKIIVDPYHGLDDLEKGILRHTSPKFTEDPLRVLRIMQLLPRKGKTVAKETVELCRSMFNEYSSLAKERVFEEWDKLLMKAGKPSKGLRFLVDCNWIKHYSELDSLRDTMQNPDWHPEGTVWNHTLMVVDNAAKLKQHIPEEWKQAYMFGCLLHDVGKAVTAFYDYHSIGHDGAGISLAKDFMERITEEKKLTEQVLDIVKYHMRPGQLFKEKAKESAWKRLHNLIPLNIIAYVSKADSLGRGERKIDDQHSVSEKALELFEKYGQKPIPQVLMGRDLIEAGYTPGEIFGKMLRQAYEIQIEEGITEKKQLLERVKHMYTH